MRSDQLSTAQTAVRAVKLLSVWLLVLVLVLYALAIYLAKGVRRRTLRNVGFALVLVGVVVLVVRRVAGNYAIDALTSPTYRGTVHDVWLIGSSILGEIGRATILYGLVAAAGAILAGPTAWALAARRFVAPTLNRRPVSRGPSPRSRISCSCSGDRPTHCAPGGESSCSAVSSRSGSPRSAGRR